MQILLLLIFTKFAKFLTISHIQSLYSLVVRKNYLDLIIIILISYNYYKGRPLQLLASSFGQGPQDDNGPIPLVFSLAGEKPNLNDS